MATHKHAPHRLWLERIYLCFGLRHKNARMRRTGQEDLCNDLLCAIVCCRASHRPSLQGYGGNYNIRRLLATILRAIKTARFCIDLRLKIFAPFFRISRQSVVCRSLPLRVDSRMFLRRRRALVHVHIGSLGSYPRIQPIMLGVSLVCSTDLIPFW